MPDSVKLIPFDAQNSTHLGLGAWAFLVAFAALCYGLGRARQKRGTRRLTTGVEGLIGQIGNALEPVGKTGRIFVNGEVWQAELKEGLVNKDERVRVIAIEPGMRLIVERVLPPQ